MTVKSSLITCQFLLFLQQMMRRGRQKTKQRKKKPRRDRAKEEIKEEVKVAREETESPIFIDDDEIVVSDSNSMDVDVKIIEETSPIKLPPSAKVSLV